MADIRVRSLDLQAQYASLRDEIRPAVDAVLEAQTFVLGPVVERFERALAAYLGAPHVVGVASGTDALYLALVAAGVGPGDAVVTTPYSFIASTSAIVRAGARPYFVDVEPATLNLDPAALGRWLDACRREAGLLRAPGGEAVRAVLPVHLFGLPSALDVILPLAAAHDLVVVEDAAQAIGARLGDAGPFAGAAARFGCFSFYPTKNLGGAGDGGAVVCARAEDAARVRSIARHGAEGHRYQHVVLGLASRLDALQAAILGVKLPHVDAWNAARRRHAARYDELLRTLPQVVRPAILPGHVFHQYVVRVPERDRVRAAMAAAGVETQVYYPIPIHLQPVFAGLGYRSGDLPVAEAASRDTLALPLYAELSDEDTRVVVDALTHALR